MQTKRHVDLMNADIARLRRVALSNAELFVVWVCQSALGQTEAQRTNPLLQKKGSVPQPAAPNYSELARSLLGKLAPGARLGGRGRFDGYVSMLDWFVTRWSLPDKIDQSCFERVSAERWREEVVGHFFRSLMVKFETGIQCLLEVVHQGMPLYRLRADGSGMEWVSYADDDYIYLSVRGQNFDVIDIDRIPRWATSYFFKPAHLDAHWQLFGNESRSLSAEDVAARRRALRQQIGAPMGNAPKRPLLGNCPVRVVGVEPILYVEDCSPSSPRPADTAARAVAAASPFVHIARVSQSVRGAIMAVSKRTQVGGFIAWLAVCFIAAAIGAVASVQAGSFYLSLSRPDWAPPASVFGPVWTALYMLMAIAAWLVWREGGYNNARAALNLFLAQLALNALWSWLFFAWHLGGPAFVDVLVLWALLMATLIAFWRIRPLAGLLLVPYLLWVSFAAVLNYTVWQMNPDTLGR